MSAGERRFMKTNANSTASLEPSTHEADFEATDKDFERMMQMLTGFFVTQIASAVATYSIADHLAKGPATAEKIAAIEGIDSTATFRLLRACGNVRMGGLPEETGSLWMRDKTERRVNQAERPCDTHHQGQPQFAGKINELTECGKRSNHSEPKRKLRSRPQKPAQINEFT